MRLITVLIEDDVLEEQTHIRVIESGNGSRETEKEIEMAMRLRAALAEEASKIGIIQGAWTAEQKN